MLHIIFVTKLYFKIIFIDIVKIYLDLEGDLLSDVDLTEEFDTDLLPEWTGELETERLPDFDLVGDIDVDLDILRDRERDLDPISSFEPLHGELLLPEWERLHEELLLPEWERLNEELLLLE